MITITRINNNFGESEKGENNLFAWFSKKIENVY